MPPKLEKFAAGVFIVAAGAGLGAEGAAGEDKLKAELA